MVTTRIEVESRLTVDFAIWNRSNDQICPAGVASSSFALVGMANGHRVGTVSTAVLIRILWQRFRHQIRFKANSTSNFAVGRRN
jgi:hypothetical protein